MSAWNTAHNARPGQWKVMPEPIDNKITGFVMPIGNGAVGKTSLSMTLEKRDLPEDWERILNQLHKSHNLDFRYYMDTLTIKEATYQVLHQYLVPPGQKALDLSETGRSFENVIEIYRSMIRRVDVGLFLYKINDIDSYHDIEYWVEKVMGIVNDSTNFIMVGTHLDKADQREVTPQILDVGKKYVFGLIKKCRPTWRGYLNSLEVSNVSGENINRLRKLISGGILLASGFQIR
jgi:GTPase SAR1 family protein